MPNTNQEPVLISSFLEVLPEILVSISKDVALNNLMFDLKSDSQDIQRQLGVLQSETVELADAIVNRDDVEFFDGLGDCLYVIGSVAALEPAMWLDFFAVRESLHIIQLALHGIAHADWKALLQQSAEIAMSNNLTKYDTSFEDAEKTQAAYYAKGIDTEIRKLQDTMFIVCATKTDPAKDVVKGKVLKSVVRHTKPDFRQVARQTDIAWAEIV